MFPLYQGAVCFLKHREHLTRCVVVQSQNPEQYVCNVRI